MCVATTNYCLDNHQHGYSKQLVFRHKTKTPANYSSEQLVEMLAEFFVADDLRYQVSEHHHLSNGRFVIDFGMRSVGTVYDKLLHYVSFGLEVRGWQVELHRSPVYAEWERSELFFFIACFILYFNLPLFLELQKLESSRLIHAHRLHKNMGIFQVKVKPGDDWLSWRFPSDMPLALLEAVEPWKNSCMKNYLAVIKASMAFNSSADASVARPVYPCSH